MKKANLLITIALMLILISGLAFGAIVTNTNTSSQVRQRGGMIQIDLNGQLIATSNAVNYDFDWVGDWDGINFYLPVQSTGNITTSTLSFRQYPATTGIEVSSVNLVSGTPVVQLNSGFMRVTLTNAIAAPAFVTGNLMIWNN